MTERLSVMKSKFLTRFFYVTFFLLVCAINPVQASEWMFTGNLKLLTNETVFPNKSSIASNERIQQHHVISTRLMTEYQKDNFNFDFHYDFKAQYLSSNTSNSTLDIESRQLIDLQANIIEKEKIIYANRIDRLIISYTKEKYVLRAGRQAVSWGNGFLFNPLDLLNPYSQTAIDREYKAGDDMLYGQYLADNGDDIQLVFVPRRNKITGDLSDKESSLLFKYKSINYPVNIDVLAARHYNDNIIAMGLLKDIKDSIVRFDMSVTHLQDDSIALMVVSNIDYSWTMFGKNTYGYLEYMYNSMGINDYQEIFNSNVLSRIERGEMFTIGRHYFSVGLTLETTPLTSLNTNLVLNLTDQSVLVPISFSYNWKQNINLLFGATLSLGGNNTEYGGYDSARPIGQSMFGQLAYYF